MAPSSAKATNEAPRSFALGDAVRRQRVDAERPTTLASDDAICRHRLIVRGQAEVGAVHVTDSADQHGRLVLLSRARRIPIRRWPSLASIPNRIGKSCPSRLHLARIDLYCCALELESS